LEIMLDSNTRVNSMNERMHRDIAYVWRDVDMDESIRSVLVRGTETAFSAGGDFELVADMIANDQALIRVWKEAKDLVYNMIDCSKPIVSAIRGPAVGAGLAVALLADVPVAARSARIVDGHTKLGVAAGDFAVIIWPLLCGMAKAKYYLLTGKPIDGMEAERIGLVALCVEDGELKERSESIARELGKASSTAVRWTKQALNNWLRAMGPAFDESLALEMLGFRLPDIREGLAAVREKRLANFDHIAPSELRHGKP
jgi:enoyl-CoA hydratase